MAGIYIHIPFCTSRCVYCDFYSTTYGEKDKAYISALRNELRLRANYLQQDGQMPVIETIYIGGGTPSTLDTSLLEPIFEVLYRTYHVSDRAEITIEANPDDLTPRKIKSLRTLPVNRIRQHQHRLDLRPPGTIPSRMGKGREHSTFLERTTYFGIRTHLRRRHTALGNAQTACRGRS